MCNGDELQEQIMASAAPAADIISLDKIYAETFGLMNETVDYLEKQKKAGHTPLPAAASCAYIGESMRLTTRLMQMAGWLMMQRAVHNGEMSAEEARRPEHCLGSIKVCVGPPMEGAGLLPREFTALLTRSQALFDRVRRLEQQFLNKTVEASPVQNIMRDLSKRLTPDS